jgi:hypothetical protein
MAGSNTVLLDHTQELSEQYNVESCKAIGTKEMLLLAFYPTAKAAFESMTATMQSRQNSCTAPGA